MTKTKKGFMLAGGIISIVFGAFIALFGLLMMTAIKGMITLDFVEEVLINSGMAGQYTTEELEAVVAIYQALCSLIGFFCICLAVGSIVPAIFVVKNACKGVSPKGSIITTLVFSVLAGNIVTIAFMIVTLCLKDKPAEQPEQPETIEVQ